MSTANNTTANNTAAGTSAGASPTVGDSSTSMFWPAALILAGAIIFSLWLQIFAFEPAAAIEEYVFHMDFTEFNNTCRDYVLPYNYTIDPTTANLTSIQVYKCRSSGLLLTMVAAAFVLSAALGTNCVSRCKQCWEDKVRNRIARLRHWIGGAVICGVAYVFAKDFIENYFKSHLPDFVACVVAYISLRDELGDISVFFRHALLACEMGAITVALALGCKEVFSLCRSCYNDDPVKKELDLDDIKTDLQKKLEAIVKSNEDETKKINAEFELKKIEIVAAFEDKRIASIQNNEAKAEDIRVHVGSIREDNESKTRQMLAKMETQKREILKRNKRQQDKIVKELTREIKALSDNIEAGTQRTVSEIKAANMDLCNKIENFDKKMSGLLQSTEHKIDELVNENRNQIVKNYEKLAAAVTKASDESKARDDEAEKKRQPKNICNQ